MPTTATSPAAAATAVRIPFSPRNGQGEQRDRASAKRRRISIGAENRAPNLSELEWSQSMITPPGSPEKKSATSKSTSTEAKEKAAEDQVHAQAQGPSTPTKKEPYTKMPISPLRMISASSKSGEAIGTGTTKTVEEATVPGYVVANGAPSIERNVIEYLREHKGSVSPHILVAAGKPEPSAGHKYNVIMERAKCDVFEIIKASEKNEDTIKLCYLDMAKGLKGLHELGLMHGDFKENNALVMKRLHDNNYVIKVMDFDRTLALESATANTHYIDEKVTWFSSTASATHPDIFEVITDFGKASGKQIKANPKYDIYTYAAFLFKRLTGVSPHQFQDKEIIPSTKKAKTARAKNAIRNHAFKHYHKTGGHQKALTEIRRQIDTTDGFVRLTINKSKAGFRSDGFRQSNRDLINWCLDQLDTSKEADPQAMKKVIPLLEASLPPELLIIAGRNAHFERVLDEKKALPIAKAGGGAAAEGTEKKLPTTEKQDPVPLSPAEKANAGTPEDSGKGSLGSGKSSA